MKKSVAKKPAVKASKSVVEKTQDESLVEHALTFAPGTPASHIAASYALKHDLH